MALLYPAVLAAPIECTENGGPEWKEYRQRTCQHSTQADTMRRAALPLAIGSTPTVSAPLALAKKEKKHEDYSRVTRHGLEVSH